MISQWKVFRSIFSSGLSVEDKRLEKADEMDMLGLYYDNDLQIDPVFDGYDSVISNGYKKDFDNYFEGNGSRPKKKRLKK